MGVIPAKRILSILSFSTSLIEESPVSGRTMPRTSIFEEAESGKGNGSIIKTFLEEEGQFLHGLVELSDSQPEKNTRDGVDGEGDGDGRCSNAI